MAIINKQDNLLRYAEETAYSSKGHFKTADFLKISLRFYISVPIILSIVLIVYGDMPIALSRLFNCLSLIFSFLALTSPMVSNQDQACRKMEEHMSLGNSYLELHKEIRNLATEDSITKEQLNDISKKMVELDSKSKNFQISFIGRIWSKWRIKKEMNLEWIYK
jgi:hypothetical protein